MSLPPASGTGRYFAKAAKSIRLIRQGCTNRPFYHISVTQLVRKAIFSLGDLTGPVSARPLIYFSKPDEGVALFRGLCTRFHLEFLLTLQRRRLNSQPVIEQLGSYDPMPNINNEKLVALNLERIKYWLGKGAHVTTPVAELFGVSGFFPIHPRTYMTAWRNRQVERETLAQQAEAEKAKETTA